jgi:hypothetical protein
MEIRGLLCARCNSAIQWSERWGDKAKLLSMAQYVITKNTLARRDSPVERAALATRITT